MSRSKAAIIADTTLWSRRLAAAEDLAFGLAAVGSVDEVLDYCSPNRDERLPDLIVAELDLPGGGAAALCHRLTAEVPVLVAIDGHGQRDVLDSLAAGACGCLVRASDLATIQREMARAADGKPVINWSLAAMILSHFRSVGGAHPARPTPIERQILQLVARSHRLTEIADTVRLAESEVEDLIRVLFTKFQESRRAFLASTSPNAAANSPYATTGHGPT